MSKSSRTHWLGVTLLLLLAGCGGSSSTEENADGAGDEAGVSGTGSDSTTELGTPNIAVVDFLGMSTVAESRLWSFTVTLKNTGTATVWIDSALLMESATPDFSSGFVFMEKALTPDANSSQGLAPGETGTYSGSGMTYNNVASTEAYMQLWFNPDPDAIWGTYLDDRFEELDYSDNLSSILTVNMTYGNYANGSFPNYTLCPIDEEGSEENDVPDAAVEIALNTTYETILCLDYIDFYKIQLAAGQAYEISFGGDRSGTLYQVISPDGSIVVENMVSTIMQSGSVFRAPLDGTYTLVFFADNGMPDSDLITFTVSTQ